MTGKLSSIPVGRAFPAMLVSSMLLFSAPVLSSAGQAAPPQQPGGYNRPHLPGSVPNEPEPSVGPSGLKLEHMREDDRRKHLMADTEKLLQLSTELKSEVDKTSKDELSIDVVRKAAEIEKLAHDVKERMKS